jgi:4-amino-4-deoxy-L-arabinose transferase-like glycosyltransferase
LILFGSVFWTVFATLTMFDLMLAFCALLSLLGLVRAWRAADGRGRIAGFALFGLGIGLGVLAKGPAILLHTLPVAVLAPLWGSRLQAGPPVMSWGQWYGGIAAGVALGAAMGLAWAIPAAIAGGPAFAHAIFIGQSAGRMVESFAHHRPWWWYAVALAPLLWPWAIWPALWRAVGGVRVWRAGRGFAATLADGGVRFSLIWLAVAFAAFSAISGKQLHYLLPEFPALALVFAFLVAEAEGGAVRQGNPMIDQAVPGIFAAFIGAIMAALPLLPLPPRLAERIALVESFWLLAFAAAGFAVAALTLWHPARALKERTLALAALSAVLVIVVHLAARPQIAASLDLRVPAERLLAWQEAGEALAHVGKYHGQFNFLGRLEKPVATIGLVNGDIERWLDAHPAGKVVSYRSALPPSDSPQPVFTYPFRGELIAVWDRAQLAADPDIADRD